MRGIFPAECAGRPGGAYSRLQSKAEELSEAFLESLTEEQRKTYNTLCEVQQEAGFLEEANTFAAGFKLGVQFMVHSYME